MRRILRLLLTVSLLSIFGYSEATTASAAAATSYYRAVTPTRVFDSSINGRVAANQPVSIGVVGSGQVPAGSTAAVLSVIASSPSVAGGLIFHASGSVTPLQSMMTLPPTGSSAVQTVVVPLGTDGKVEALSSAAVDLSVDVVGFYASASSSRSGRYRAIADTKVVDRSTVIVPVGGEVEVKVPDGVGRDAEAVVLTVSVSGAIRNGSWWLSSMGVTRPVASGRLGESASNTVIARPTNGALKLSTDSGGFVVVTVSGWYTGRSASSGSDGLFVAQAPMRLVDTTSALDPLGVGVALHANWTLEAPVLGLAGVPATGVGAVVVVVATSNTMGSGATTAYAAGQARPATSHVLASRAGNRASVTLNVSVGDRGVAVFSAPGADVTVDVVGWFTGTAKTSVVVKPINVMPTAATFPGLLWVPDLRLFTSVREDTSWVNLDPSHLPESRSPNQPGNVAIFGHRTSHGHEFRNLDRMKQGSLIVLAVGGAVYWYRTTSVEILSPEDPLLYATNSNDQTITLVACHPPGSVKFRIVARATLVSVT